jgi:exosome complex RNA-binding protein Rrp42 (RNase PH superfamily)
MNDVNSEEERLSKSQLTAMFDSSEKMVRLLQMGGKTMDLEETKLCIDQCKNQAQLYRKSLMQL